MSEHTLDSLTWELFRERTDDVDDETLPYIAHALEEELEQLRLALMQVTAEMNRRLSERRADTIATDTAKYYFDEKHKWSPDLAMLAQVLPATVAASLFYEEPSWTETVEHPAQWRLKGRNVTALVNAVRKLPEAERNAVWHYLGEDVTKKVRWEVS